MARRKNSNQQVQPVYVVTTPFGPHFCFNAADDTDAAKKLNGWLRYHSYTQDMGYGFELLHDTHPAYCHTTENIHNEWMR